MDVTEPMGMAASSLMGSSWEGDGMWEWRRECATQRTPARKGWAGREKTVKKAEEWSEVGVPGE